MATATAKRRNVVLHFDLNRTVLMSDAAGGRTMENTVDYLLSECTWGYIHPQNPQEWVCVSEASSVEPPATTSVSVDGQQVPLITYKQFVDDSHPYRSLASASETGSSIEEIKAFNKTAKKLRTALQSAFTGGDGPGSRVRGSFDEVMQKLHFPPGSQQDAAKRLASTMPISRLQEAWSEGRYYLLPSFIQFLSYLAASSEKYDVKLVLRTFGDDVPEVAKELEFLVEGTHPFSLGTKLPEQFKLNTDSDTGLNQRIGTFYRDGFTSEGTALAVGTLTKVPFSSANQGDTTAIQKFYDGKPVEIVRGFPAIHDKISEMFNHGSIIALRDYWEWWSAHAEAGEYGKLLLVNDHETQNDDVVVFFDDHIEVHHSHIVDVRDITGEPVPFEKSNGKYLHRVEPFAAITDPLYFIKLLEKILA